MMDRRRLGWRFWIGVGVSLICLFLLFNNLDLAELIDNLGQVSLFFFGLGLLSFTVYLSLAAKRWQILLSPIGEITWADSISYGLIGLLANNILPLRIGDVAKSVLLANKVNKSRSAFLATVFVERLLDIVALLVFIVVLFFVIELPPEIKTTFIILGTACAVFILFFGLLLKFGGQKTALGLVLRFIPERFKDRSAGLLDAFLSGMMSLGSAVLLLRSLILSVLAWSFVGLSAWFFLLSVQLSLPWYAPIFVVVVTNLGGIVPASPGSFGVFDALVVYVLSLWGTEKEISLTMAIVYHGGTYLLVTLLGLFFLWRERYSFSQLATVSEG